MLMIKGRDGVQHLKCFLAVGKVEFFVPFESAAQILESVGIGENTSIHLAGISCYQCVFLSF